MSSKIRNLLEQDPAGTIGHPVAHSLQVVVRGDEVVLHVDISIAVPQASPVPTPLSGGHIRDTDSKQFSSTGTDPCHLSTYILKVIVL